MPSQDGIGVRLYDRAFMSGAIECALHPRHGTRKHILQYFLDPYVQYYSPPPASRHTHMHARATLKLPRALTSAPTLRASSTGKFSKNLCGSDSGSSATHTPRVREHANPSLCIAHRSTRDGPAAEDESLSSSFARALLPPFLLPLPLMLGTVVPRTIHRRISEK